MKRYAMQFAGLAVLGLYMFGCDSIVNQKPVADEEFSAEQTIQGAVVMDDEQQPCQIQCIDSEAPEYVEVNDERVVSWGGRANDSFSKTVAITYYNTLTHFVLKVRSTNGIADVLLDEQSVKDFEGTITEDTWHQFTFPLADDWQACDPWTAGLKVTGYGPPAYFAVSYQLIGECGWPRDTSTEVVEVINPSTGRVWMDRNLGASRAAISSTDAEAYGDLYQWGRPADGHQLRNSPTTNTLSRSDQPGHGDFILVSSSPYDWRSPQNDNLWQGVNGVNNPCPPGYRLPTDAELNAERLSWSSDNASGAFASPLKLPMAGSRHFSSGSPPTDGFTGFYWSSSVDGTLAWYILFESGSTNQVKNYRTFGFSVRCIKD